VQDADAAIAGRASAFRWAICALLFAATAINYVDRQIIGVLKPVLQKEYGWNEIAYGDIVFWFQAAYALGYIGFGRIVDKIGARFGYALAVVIWTAAHVAHAFVSTIGGFTAVRIALGFGESGNFPAGIKAVTEWFPKRERALATGIFNAGANVGAIVTPLIVPAITLAFGWRAAFLITGLLTVVWLVLWVWVYRKPRQHPRVNAAELALIESDPPDPVETIAWVKLLPVRETWAYAIGKFLIDPIWWMFLFWLPDFFAKRYALDLQSFGPPLVAVYVLSDLGSIAGGWMSSSLIKNGTSINVARKLTMLVCSFLVMPVMFAMYANNLWLAVAIVGLATAAHQAFSANLYTIPSDVFPRAAVASVVGIGGTAGAIGGMIMAKFAGYVLERIGSYTPIFIVAGSVYLIALILIHLLSPRLAPVTLEGSR
jgi:ACS family hexuronate transporter-like MFS transporter